MSLRRQYRKGGSDSAVTATTKRAKVAFVTALVQAMLGAFLAAFRFRASLVAENLVLGQQLAILDAGRRRSLKTAAEEGERAARHAGTDLAIVAPSCARRVPAT